ncbi:hypothetical protein QTP88_023922 [Uroleucon formosanum]
MSDQLPSTSYVTNCSVTGNNNLIGFKPIKTFKWTPRLERYLLQNMKRVKPCELNLNISIGVLWNYMSDMWNIRFADIIENICFDNSEKDFVLPEDFNQLIQEEGEKIKNLNKECKTLIFPVMSDQLPSTSYVTNCSVTGNNNLIGFKPIKTFKWTPRLERYLLQNMKRVKPCGKSNAPLFTLFFCYTHQGCDIIENICFDNSEKDFVLPEDFNQLIQEEGEKIKNLNKECKTLIFPVMSDQLPSTSYVTNCSVTGNNNLIGFKPIKTFKWTPRLERYLLQNMKRVKPCGKSNAPLFTLFFCYTHQGCDIIENICFDNSEKDFVLPEDFNQLIQEEGEKIKNLNKECKTLIFPVMSDQLPSTSYVTNCSVTGNNNLIGFKPIKTFKWTPRLERYLLQNMKRVKPCGKSNAPLFTLFFCYTHQGCDIIENICFDNSEKDFVLPEDFNQLIQEEGEKIKNLNKECKTLIFPVMSDQLPSTSYVTNCSVTGNNNLIGFKPIKTFKWTPRLERYLLQNMKRVKPCGKSNAPLFTLFFCYTHQGCDIIENICFDNSEKDFVLPEDFNQLIQEEGEKIKNLNKECKTLIFPVMSDQLPSTSYVTNCSVTGNNNLIGFKPIKTFKWTPRLERYLLQNMKRVKPCGKSNAPLFTLFFCYTHQGCDIIENICFDNSEKDFVLPEDFNQLIQEEGEKIKNLNKEFMSDQLLSTSYVTNCSVTGNNNLIGFKPIKTFKWTPRLERYLLQNMKRVKPCGHVTQIN